MSAGWKSSTAVVVAFAIAAGVVVAVAWRTVASERIRVERDVRNRLRATAIEAAGTIASAIAQLQSRALTDPTAAIVRDGRFVMPPSRRLLARLHDSEGRDPIGDKLLEEAQRRELDTARVETACGDYAAAAADESRDPAVRRLASFRLSVVERRLGHETAAEQANATFVALLASGDDDALHTSAEALFARIEASRRSPATADERTPRDDRADDAELQADLLLLLDGGVDGGGVDAIAEGMLREANLHDDAKIAARRRELERLDRLEHALLPSFGMQSLEASGAVLSAENLVAAWGSAEPGEQRVLEAALPPLAANVRVGDRAEELGPSRSPSHAVPFTGLRQPSRALEESADIAALPGHAAIASVDESTVDAEAARRLRLVLGGLGLLLLGGAALLAFTLRAVRRESEAAAARTAFVARVSHDLRTPLSVIRMYAETLAQGRATEPGQVRDFAGVAAREAERLTSLIARVLDFSRVATHERAIARAPVDLRELLQQTASEHAQSLCTAGLHLEMVVSGEQLLVSGDAEGLRAACSNLLDNAIRHAASGGRVEVAATAREGRIEVRVADRGPGLPPGLETRIFEPFVRGPQARPGGSGLGLALVKEVASAHGGSVVANNREGGGATFTLVLPQAESSDEGGVGAGESTTRERES